MNAANELNIRRDFLEVSQKLENLAIGTCFNQIIAEPNYLNPEILPVYVTLNTSTGAFRYFLKIQRALASALTEGSIEPQDLPARAPSYLVDLVKKG
jgi:hypothetical protein